MVRVNNTVQSLRRRLTEVMRINIADHMVCVVAIERANLAICAIDGGNHRLCAISARGIVTLAAIVVMIVVVMVVAILHGI